MIDIHCDGFVWNVESLQWCHISVIESQITDNSNVSLTVFFFFRLIHNSKENIKAPYQWPTDGSTGGQWIPLGKGKLCGKRFSSRWFVTSWPSYDTVCHCNGVHRRKQYNISRADLTCHWMILAVTTCVLLLSSIVELTPSAYTKLNTNQSHSKHITTRNHEPHTW